MKITAWRFITGYFLRAVIGWVQYLFVSAYHNAGACPVLAIQTKREDLLKTDGQQQLIHLRYQDLWWDYWLTHYTGYALSFLSCPLFFISCFSFSFSDGLLKLGPSIRMVVQQCLNRSSMASTNYFCLNTSYHASKSRLVVMMVGFFR